MTCIVGIRTKFGTLIAGDSMGANSSVHSTRRDWKVANLSDEVAVGFGGSYRMGQILAHHVDVTEAEIGNDPYGWAVHEFIPGIRAVFTEHGFNHRTNGSDEAKGGVFLLAVRDRLFAVYSDYQVEENTDVYNAVGSGASVALGALYAKLGAKRTHHFVSTLTARNAAQVAIDAATEHTPFVGGRMWCAYTRCPR